MNTLRRGVVRLPPQRVIEVLLQRIKGTTTNAELLLLLRHSG